MATLPGAAASPRIENGVLRWYEGDTFRVNLLLTLKDQDGAPVTLNSGDTATLTFRDKRQTVTDTVTFTNIRNNTLPLSMDAARSARFPPGPYTYTLTLTHNNRTTLMKENTAVVE